MSEPSASGSAERPAFGPTELVVEGEAVARAQVNIALVKYWGKAPGGSPGNRNLPAVPSLSLTLDALYTETRVGFDVDADDDVVVLDGARLEGGALDRARIVLDAVRRRADVAAPFRVASVNHVPTAAGLASSASGMAALAVATARCAGLPADPNLWSRLAREGSGSASRSVFGGWVAWDGPAARPLFGPDHWDLALVVAVVDDGPKAIGSRAAMERTRRTSPYHGGWVQQARGLFDEGCAAVARRDLEALIEVMELSTLRMHAAAMAARPPVLYWAPASLAAVRTVEASRAEGILVGWTMDAGPNVKVLCAAADGPSVAQRLETIPGVQRTVVCRPGSGVRVWVEGP